MRDTLARIWFAVTAVCVIVGISISVWLAITAERLTYVFGNAHGTAEYGSSWARGLNVFTYFTIMSNVIVAVTCILLAINPRRFSSAFAVWRLTGIVAIAITGIIYNTVLAKLFVAPNVWSALSNDLEHIVVPILAVLGWLVFGPRLRFRWSTILWGALIGLAWLTFTLIRGTFPVANQTDDHWYPYPFLDVAVHGYPSTLINSVAILAFYVLLAAGVLGLDKVLPGPRDPAAETGQVT